MMMDRADDASDEGNSRLSTKIMASSIKIMAATYGPADGLITGTRDVAPFVRALLRAREQHQAHHLDEDMGGSSSPRASDQDEDQEGLYIPLMDGKSMNAIFGDPCPGTSKILFVHYIVCDNSLSRTAAAATSEVHHTTFAEHERVVLRQRTTFYQDDSKLKKAVVAVANATSDKVEPSGHEEESTLRTAVRMGRAQSIAEFAQASQLEVRAVQTLAAVAEVPKQTRKTRLRSATSEIVLPIVLPFLDLKERVNCQLVCKVWRIVVRHWGVAQTVDANDPSFRQMFSREFLRGILSHSYSSLQNLYLCDFKELKKEDLHPAIPHLRKLRALDISHCNDLDDSCLLLISQHLSHSLEVLYMKGLQKVTDEGFMSICRSCLKLQVLEISNVKITDESGIAIGENLTQLRALYMRDNFLLTNKSIDIITEKCSRLAQLTLWGCIRLKSLSFERLNQVADCGNLVLLNLWGCHSLLDDAADALAPMSNLRSLIVSECHRLTDSFLVSLAQNVPKLAHLHLRYCRRISDAGVNAITNGMQDLYSLDLSFCSRISSASILNLLEIRSSTLSELRISNCSQLRISMSDQSNTGTGGNANTGRIILNLLQYSNDALSILDVSRCGGLSNADERYSDDDPFVQGMESLQFKQVAPGFFSRPAQCTDSAIERLCSAIDMK
jgi:hypothetical protein